MAKVAPLTTTNTPALVPQDVAKVRKARAKRVKQQRRTKPRGRGQ
jgi:hypothetical protein